VTALDPEVMAGHYVGAIVRGADGLADWWADRLDSLDAGLHARLSSPTVLADSAAWYAGQGLPIFPLQPGSKIPLPGSWSCCGGSHRRGCLDALAHVGAARAWWRAHPTANIGLATGHRVDVIDQDGTAGAVHWCRGAGWPDVLGMVSTPRPGGVHRYVRASGHGNGASIAPGIDYRGRGGYVVAPPSVVNGKRYTWLRGLDLRGR
jgi:hypothetical protein